MSDPLGPSPVPLLPASEFRIGAFDLSPDGQSIAFMNILTGNGYHDVWESTTQGSSGEIWNLRLTEGDNDGPLR